MCPAEFENLGERANERELSLLLDSTTEQREEERRGEPRSFVGLCCWRYELRRSAADSNYSIEQRRSPLLSEETKIEADLIRDRAGCLAGGLRHVRFSLFVKFKSMSNSGPTVSDSVLLRRHFSHFERRAASKIQNENTPTQFWPEKIRYFGKKWVSFGKIKIIKQLQHDNLHHRLQFQLGSGSSLDSSKVKIKKKI